MLTRVTRDERPCVTQAITHGAPIEMQVYSALTRGWPTIDGTSSDGGQPRPPRPALCCVDDGEADHLLITHVAGIHDDHRERVCPDNQLPPGNSELQRYSRWKIPGDQVTLRWRHATAREHIPERIVRPCAAVAPKRQPLTWGGTRRSRHATMAGGSQRLPQRRCLPGVGSDRRPGRHGTGMPPDAGERADDVRRAGREGSSTYDVGARRKCDRPEIGERLIGGERGWRNQLPV